MSVNMKRWENKPNNWPTGLTVERSTGFLGWLFNIKRRGVVGEYAYASGSTYVPVHMDNGVTEWVHISKIPGALD